MVTQTKSKGRGIGALSLVEGLALGLQDGCDKIEARFMIVARRLLHLTNIHDSRVKDAWRLVSRQLGVSKTNQLANPS